MSIFTIDGHEAVAIRQIPFITGWDFPPDSLVDYLSGQDETNRVLIPSYHLSQDGSYHEMLPKEWRVIETDLEAYSDSLSLRENYKNELYREWRGDSIQIYPPSTFVWKRDLETAYFEVFSEENLNLAYERPQDRELNFYPFIRAEILSVTLEGFEHLLEDHTSSNNAIVRFKEIHQFLILDPFYGSNNTSIDSVIDRIYQSNSNNALFGQFYDNFQNLRIKTDKQRHLIYLWCGLMGLPCSINNNVITWHWSDYLTNWTKDFDIYIDDLKEFLRQHSLPLPMHFFPDDIDNTKKKSELNSTDSKITMHEFETLLPKLEKELMLLTNIQPESMAAHHEREKKIKKVQLQIDSLKNGNYSKMKETPKERKTRLKEWLEEELKQGERGAITRTAKREGITRQALSKIVKRNST